jgi:hypothetical protein
MPTREENATEAVAVVQKYVPKFERLPKASSTFQRFLASLLRLIGMKDFMSRFSTTIGFTAYLIESHYNNLGVIFHEGRHAWQGKKYTRVGQGALYLLPQLLGIGALCASVTLLVLSLTGFTWSWWPLAFLLIFAAPLPAYWRMKFEFDAYCVSMAVRYWCRGELDDDYINRLIKNFTTSAYYFMWPFKGSLRKRFLRKLEWIKSPAVANDPYYLAIHRFLEERGLLKGANA